MGSTEHAREEVRHEAHHVGDNDGAKRIAVLVPSPVAIQVGEKHERNEYLTSHISLTSDRTFYQAKNLRSVAAERAAYRRLMPGGTGRRHYGIPEIDGYHPPCPCTIT